MCDDDYEDEFPEIEIVEIPVVKRMLFQFKKPVKLDFDGTYQSEVEKDTLT